MEETEKIHKNRGHSRQKISDKRQWLARWLVTKVCDGVVSNRLISRIVSLAKEYNANSFEISKTKAILTHAPVDLDLPDDNKRRRQKSQITVSLASRRAPQYALFTLFRLLQTKLKKLDAREEASKGGASRREIKKRALSLLAKG